MIDAVKALERLNGLLVEAIKDSIADGMDIESAIEDAVMYAFNTAAIAAIKSDAVYKEMPK